MKAILGIKLDQTNIFTKEEIRVPITRIKVGPQYLVNIKESEKDGYRAYQLGIGVKKSKNTKKSILGFLKKTGLEKNPPRYIKEIKFMEEMDSDIKIGEKIDINKIFQEGDLVQVTGISKGKGFQGGVKRHHFKGGPRTHGQSDRERSPGSIGQTTTPGRVYKGKRMAGRMGNDQVTIKNLKVISIDSRNEILNIKGLAPGGRNSLLIIKSV
jgi:large subunit ribosomal protein L3